LAYLIGRRHWHRGYATQATGMLIAFGFRCLTLDWIYSSCLPENAGARRVLEKLGFRYTREGPMPDPGPGQSERLLHFEFSRRQWEARTTE
jgi:RimJ/RimL family protein N-acetyltransferase